MPNIFIWQPVSTGQGWHRCTPGL